VTNFGLLSHDAAVIEMPMASTVRMIVRMSILLFVQVAHNIRSMMLVGGAPVAPDSVLRVVAIEALQCPLLAQSGQSDRTRVCPLFGHPDFTDDIEIGPIRLKHEKFAHRDRVFEHDVGDVEIVGNHH
jgi:hypothetical protein